MTSSIWRDLLKLLVGTSILLVGFYLLSEWWKPNIDVDKSDITLSIEQEERIGDFMVDLYFSELPRVQDSAVLAAISHIEERLLSSIDSSTYTYNIHVLDVDIVNALTFPGGNIVVFSGLLEFADSPEEVAAVMAHEIGHAEQRHVVQKMATEIGLSILVSIVSGGDVSMIHELAHMLVSSVFSRQQESEADMFGLHLLEQAGINPSALADFFQRMSDEGLDYDERLEWMMSHPHNKQRIQSSLDYPLPSHFKVDSFPIEWNMVKDRM